MNELSWLLYLGNVAGNLGPLLGFVGFFSACLGIGLWVDHNCKFGDVVSAIRFSISEEKRAELLDKLRPMRTVSFLCFVLTTVLWVSAAFVPSQQTVYAIAASEVGERALQTPLAQKTTKALELWLDAQIKGLSPKQDE